MKELRDPHFRNEKTKTEGLKLCVLCVLEPGHQLFLCHKLFVLVSATSDIGLQVKLDGSQVLLMGEVTDM